jgi:hypothetical protein
MRFSEIEFKHLRNSSYADESIENEIEFNLLNFIRCIHLNKQDFYSESFETQYFGDLEMIFKKHSGSLIGYCRAIIKKEDKVVDYLLQRMDLSCCRM